MSGLPPALARPDMDADEVTAALIGGWQLVDWSTYYPDGRREQPFGADAIGQIMYSADRHMTCHLARANRPLVDAGYLEVPDETLGRVIRSYSGYWGSFTVDAAAGLVIHHVTGAWYPNFAAVDQPRRYAFEDDLLFLEADIAETRVRLTWQRRQA
jgi:hypothetical protein